MKKEALTLASQHGFHVFPVSSPLAGGPAAGKRPLVKAWQDVATVDPKSIEEWWDRWPEANIGIATGAKSSVWVLDVDVKKEDGFASLRKLDQELGGLPETLKAKSGSGGLHLYFRYEQGSRIPSRTGVLPGLDVRGDGGYIVAPPSLHISGNHYEWI